MQNFSHSLQSQLMAADEGAPGGGEADGVVAFADPPGGLQSLADVYGPLVGEPAPKKPKAPAAVAQDAVGGDGSDVPEDQDGDDGDTETPDEDEDAEAPAKPAKGKAVAEDAPKLVDRVVGNKLVKMTPEAAEALDAETERQASARRQSTESPRAEVDPKQSAKERQEALGRLDKNFSEIVNDKKDFDGFTDGIIDLVTPLVQNVANRIANAKIQALHAEVADLRDRFASVSGDTMLEQEVAGELETELAILGFEDTQIEAKDVVAEMKRVIASAPRAFSDVATNGATVRRALTAAVSRLARAAHKPGRKPAADEPEDVEMANLRESRPPAPNASAPSPGSGGGVPRGSQGRAPSYVDKSHQSDAEFLASFRK